MNPRPLLIDCDPGVDDAVALLLAFASPELHLLGITTVAGNVPLALTQANARRICELGQRSDIPVFAGCPRPMMRSLATAEEVHGKTGLGARTLPDPQMPLQPTHAVDFLIETAMNAPEPITLATLGPLTNVAIALIKAPQIADHIDEIVMMGGATTFGNVTPLAEFNIYVDPHAAQVVLSSGIAITLLGLDVTHQVLTTPERLDAIRAIKTPVSQAVAELLHQYGMHDVERFGMAGSPLHDPNVIAYLLRPDLYTGKHCYVEVETTSPAAMGQTIVDWWQLSDRPPNVTVIATADDVGVYDLLIQRLATL